MGSNPSSAVPSSPLLEMSSRKPRPCTQGLPRLTSGSRHSVGTPQPRKSFPLDTGLSVRRREGARTLNHLFVSSASPTPGQDENNNPKRHRFLADPLWKLSG